LKKLAILGSGDLGQLIAHHAEEDGHYSVVGFFDDFMKEGSIIGQVKVIGKLNEVFEKYEAKKFDEIIIGIGYKHIQFRKNIFEKFFEKIPFAKIIHSSSYVDKSCKVSEGCFVLPGCVLDKGVVLNSNVLMNTASVIAHDSIIGAHTFISPSVSIAGFVNIGQCCNIGINSTIIDNVSICDNVQVGGGGVVIKNIVKSGLYVGNPVKYIR
jgi:sugar O-acyltransferase (sialic acid O-acetyltransferase NeuD family)